MEFKKINSALAMLNVLSDYGVKHIYGLPGGSINSTMEALYNDQSNIEYIQVRHEEVGALAAAAHSKLTKKIGVCFGSAGPGAVHLLNGLYDAKHDKTPVLAIIGQVSSKFMNTNYFQEMNEDPMLRDVSVYNRVVMDPQQMPYMVEDAIRAAYEYNGVACLTIPVDFGTVDINDTYITSAKQFNIKHPIAEESDIDAAIDLLKQAKQPLLFYGIGAKGCKDELKELSTKLQMPVVSTALARNIIGDDFENYLKASGRLGTKPATEAIAHADLIMFVGSDFPFAQVMFRPDQKFIQIDIKPSIVGKRHRVDVGINADAKSTLRSIIDKLDGNVTESAYLKACKINMDYWNKYTKDLANLKLEKVTAENIMANLANILKDDAIIVGDVGNVSIQCVRNIDFKPNQLWTTSGIYATMGYGVCGGIAAKLAYPSRQVVTVNGDGGFSMVCQDILTQVKYNLPVINIVMSNDSLGFIESEQYATQHIFGVDLYEADFGLMAKSMSAVGYTVNSIEELKMVFEQDEVINPTKPVVIDVKISQNRPLPTHRLELDPNKFSQEQISNFKKAYYINEMPLFKDILAKLI
ncbi:pyruvate oxidase [Mycoplasma sp. P36-A1]|uniref:pyruvate oxidase n=1 Tax=Mycoplasma sp. P36-A1 TaxID=3252900 RepID=UPI003C2BCA8B